MIRPVDAEISQHFGDNPTRNLPTSSWLIQTFGNYQPDGHTGEDYACQVGTPVRAVADGTVLHIGWMGGTYDQNPWWIQPSFAGYHAVIDHGSFIGIYGHCSDGSARVAKGDRVSEGQVFILSGNTGGSTGPHLHFEILPDGWVLNSKYYGRIDPEPLFSSTISAQSVTITPMTAPQAVTPEEEDDMPSAAEIAKEIMNYNINRQGPGQSGQTNLAAALAWADANNASVVRATADAVLNTPVKRQGQGAGLGESTSLGALVAWHDSGTLDVIAAVAASAANDGATVEQIKAAVTDALREGTVKVDVTVEGAK